MNREQRRRTERAINGDIRKAQMRGSASGLAAAARTALDADLPQQAEAVLRAALELNGATEVLGDIHQMLGEALLAQGRMDEATLHARRALRTDGTNARSLLLLGKILEEDGRSVEAVRVLERTVALHPRSAAAHNALGTALLSIGQLAQAEAALRTAAELDSNDPLYPRNLGVACERMGRFSAALDAYGHAAALPHGDSATLRWNRAFARLGVGDVVGGLEDYEAGRASGGRQPRRDPGVPDWDGSPAPDARVVFYREQGLGDELRFASCLPEVLPLIGSPVLEVSERLVSLFQRTFPGVEVRASGPLDPKDGSLGRIDDADAALPLGSVPRLVRRHIDDFPAGRTGWLQPCPTRSERIGQRLATDDGDLLVGFSWRSMVLSTSRLASYTTLPEWEPIFRLPGIRFVNLQYGDVDLRERELREVEDRFGIEIVRFDDLDYTDDLESVAALTSQLDVVVGPASLPTVMAASLGIRTAVLGRVSGYHLGTGRDPWFPAIELFTRRWDQTWEGAVQSVADHLARLAADHRQQLAADLRVPSGAGVGQVAGTRY